MPHAAYHQPITLKTSIGRVLALKSEAPEIRSAIKRIKRVAFGVRRFRHYRIRVLLYAGRPDWDLLDTITPR